MATKLARVLCASVFLFALGFTPYAFASDDTDQGTEQVDPCGDEMNPCDDEQGMMEEDIDIQSDTEEGQVDEEVEIIQVDE